MVFMNISAQLERFQWILEFYIRHLNSKAPIPSSVPRFPQTHAVQIFAGCSFSFVRSFSTFVHSLVHSSAKPRAKSRRRCHGYRRKMFKYLPRIPALANQCRCMFLDFTRDCMHTQCTHSSLRYDFLFRFR